MKDITKCLGTDCKKKDKCIRFLHPPRDKWQSYVIMGVSVPDVDKCKFYAETYEAI